MDLPRADGNAPNVTVRVDGEPVARRPSTHRRSPARCQLTIALRPGRSAVAARNRGVDLAQSPAPARRPTVNRSPDSTTRRSRARRAGLLFGAAAWALVACGTGAVPAPAPPAPAPAPAPPAAAPNPEALAWTGSVCSAVGPVVATLKAPPAIDQNAWPATRQAYLSYLDDAVGRTDTALRELATAGPPPVENGPQLADQVRTQVERAAGRSGPGPGRRRPGPTRPTRPLSGRPWRRPATCWGPSPTRPRPSAQIAGDPQLQPSRSSGRPRACSQLRCHSSPRPEPALPALAKLHRAPDRDRQSRVRRRPAPPLHVAAQARPRVPRADLLPAGARRLPGLPPPRVSAGGHRPTYPAGRRGGRGPARNRCVAPAHLGQHGLPGRSGPPAAAPPGQPGVHPGRRRPARRADRGADRGPARRPPGPGRRSICCAAMPGRSRSP